MQQLVWTETLISSEGNNELSIISGYDEQRKVKNIVFENQVINGRLISDDMAAKPAWYTTADMARMSIGEHIEGILFRRDAKDEVKK